MWVWDESKEPNPYKQGWERSDPKEWGEWPRLRHPVRLTRRGRIVAFYLAPVLAGAVIYVAFLRDWYWT